MLAPSVFSGDDRSVRNRLYMASVTMSAAISATALYASEQRPQGQAHLRLGWQDNMLTIRSPPCPGVRFTFFA